MIEYRNLLVVIALLGAAGVLHAQESEFGKYLRGHGYAIATLIGTGNNAEVVQVQIEGKPTYMVVDTGAVHTIMTANWADYLDLQVKATSLPVFGVGGAMRGKAGVALVHSFKLNNYEINRTQAIYVLPKVSPRRQGKVTGILGLDFLRLNAVIFPVGSGMFLFKPGNGPVVPIDHYMALLGLRPIPLQYRLGKMLIEGHLNGRPLIAAIDSGAEFSTFDLDYVRKAGQADLTKNVRVPMRGVDGKWMVSYAFLPKEFDLGSLTMQPTAFLATRAPGLEGGFNALLGYDFLGTHHAIIDLGHDTLWMK